MKQLVILGSTGSIGTQALDVVRKHGFGVTGLSAHSNVQQMERQVREFHPHAVCMVREDAAKDLRQRIADTGTQVLSGEEGLCELVRLEQADMVLNSVIGMVGLRPTLAALEAKKQLALANKETLVAGGKLVMETARKNGVKILPVDSEHSAIFQSLGGHNPINRVNKIILTASGGPFFGYTSEQLRQVKKEDALKHPNWDMGAKITIDSASMMNKGLELIEAVWLFGVRPEQIEIVVHRESVVHSLIEYEDYSVIGQLGVPDMKIPIQYALTYPERTSCPVGRLSLTEYGKLTFYSPDEQTFPLIRTCREAIKRGGLFPCAANGANEEAVRLFLQDKIGFTDIFTLVDEAMRKQKQVEEYTLEEILEADKAAREYVRTHAAKKF
ncbi:MAG TPA: 1-deoxy-D-xylulose-5-phosphate reductoisomerase [Firmicutes bacterium]|nr:1-deoxy-D-xylulose-5-phosphate reductoisomerase [Bacillota bacterium]